MLRQTGKLCCAVLLLAAWAAASGVPGPEPAPPGGEESGSYVGVDVQDVSSDRVAALKLKEERGVEITMVDQDAPAGKAGLKEHDVILDFNGTRVESVEQLRRMIHEVPPGRRASVGISRDGQPMQFQVQLADRKQAFSKKWGSMTVPPVPPMPPIVIPSLDVTVRSYSRAGLVVDNLTPQLGEYFGVKNGEGVLVRSVEKGSPAEAAGFRAGDVIIKVDNERVADKGDWRSALRNHRKGKFNVGIMRDKREQTLSVTLPETKDDQSEINIDLPDLADEMEEVQVALNNARPQIERATQRASVQAKKAMKQGCRQLEASRKEVEKAIKEAGPELDRAMKELNRELEHMQHEIEISIGDE